VSKRYDEPIEVTPDPAVGGAPRSFSWRGRRYEVDLPLTSWCEAGESWRGSGGAQDREYFRVLARPSGVTASGDLDPDGFMTSRGAASAGPQGSRAVYDVYRDRTKGAWCLARIWD
jgi:hypothetical protein